MGAPKEAYKAIFVYTGEVLDDFEAMYLKKTAVSPVTRLVIGIAGFAGLALFVVLMIVKGFSVGFLIPAIFAGLILLLALMMGRKKNVSSVERYRKHYLNKKVHFQIDDTGVEMKINGQKAYARSKFKDVYNLLETEKTIYLEIKGRAFYILPKDSLEGSVDGLKEYLQKKCSRRFQKIELG